jgi:type II secretory pathway pseudopilin PulG
VVGAAPPAIATAVISMDPSTGSTVLFAKSVITVPVGATSGILSQAAMPNATTAASPAADASRIERVTMVAGKDSSLMHLAGQGGDGMPKAECRRPKASRAPGPVFSAFGVRHSALTEGGYAMAALLTMIAVMSILLTAALPVWRHEMQREKEAELVFRGEQYVHAIQLFFSRFRTYPPNVDVLVKQKFLRKKYLDPVTGKEFRPIYVGQLQQPGQAPQGQPSQGQQPGGATLTQPGQIGLRPGQRPPAGAGGLMGVVSTSDEDSIMIYKGRTKYSQWQFLYAGATTRPGGPGGVGRPGFPGPGGRRPGRGGPGEGGGIRRPGGPGDTLPPQGPRPLSPRPPGGD